MSEVLLYGAFSENINVCVLIIHTHMEIVLPAERASIIGRERAARTRQPGDTIHIFDFSCVDQTAGSELTRLRAARALCGKSNLVSAHLSVCFFSAVETRVGYVTGVPRS